MSLNRRLCGTLLCAVLVLSAHLPALSQEAASAAAPSESVTVTGLKDLETAIGKFVETMTVPTRGAEKLARWIDGVCPIAVGVRPEIGVFLIKRIMDVAAEVGAPINNKVPCPPNIEIIFTAEPQALLDNIRVMHPILLGYHDDSAQAEKLATSRLPIQPLYITATVDLRGHAQVDGVRKGGTSMTMAIPPAGHGGPSGGAPDMVVLNMPDAVATHVTGSRLGDGLSGALSNVVIVVDTNKLLNREVLPLADYIAMLSLSQIALTDDCQHLPTILNLMAAGCSQPAATLTASDMAYLRALYKVTPTATFHGQRNEMTYQMGKMVGAGP